MISFPFGEFGPGGKFWNEMPNAFGGGTEQGVSWEMHTPLGLAEESQQR
jgi:hypothetical protein